MFTLDGFKWDVSCKIKRKAEMTASEISGLLLDKSYFNDVIGTYMTYEVAIEVPVWAAARYAELYELLTAPVGWHTMTLPYNDSEINITGRIQVVSDIYVGVRGGKKRWRETTFTVIANHPSKEMGLSDVITAGMTPSPEPPSTAVGDLYERTTYGWIQRLYSNADSLYY